MTCRLKLKINSPKDKNLPFSPSGYIYLGAHNIDNKGRHLVTSEFTESEIESQIDYLISELEKIRAKAKKEFKRVGK